MSELLVEFPRKTRELHNHHMDSTVWNGFAFRDDDVVVATYGKAGTTWTQQIVAQLLFGAEDVDVHAISPWWDIRILPPEARAAVAAQTHRRVLKTHLPVDALVMSPNAKYLYVARDGRDVVWSLYNHHAGFAPHAYDMFNGPGLVGEPLPQPDPDIRRYFRTWLERDGYPFWSFWENTASWWAIRDLPNVRLVHFNRLKADLESEMRAIAAFLEIDLPEAKWPTAVEHCSFPYMKAHSELYAPLGGFPWEGGGETFINKGVNGRWKDLLSPAESRTYEQLAVEKLGPECARWLATGELDHAR
jgi:aryl sulfotransferase